MKSVRESYDYQDRIMLIVISIHLAPSRAPRFSISYRCAPVQLPRLLLFILHRQSFDDMIEATNLGRSSKSKIESFCKG